MGLGRVLHSTLKYADSTPTRFRHEILIIDEKHLSEESLELFSDFSDCLHIGRSDAFIREKIDQADILQIEWGNHPLMYRFLITAALPACRIILCCHVVGLTRPNIITASLIEFSDVFLAASKATRSHVLFQKGLKSKAAEKLRYVTFPVDFGRFGTITPKAHDRFNIGYVGTLDYSKLHRNFLSMSAAVDIPGVNFVICGEDRSGNLEKEAEKHSPEKFQFLGFTENIKSVLETLDVFGYPLTSDHFGSGEQAIIEAMYAGLPVVSFSNPPEKEIIIHNETGILVDDEKSYTDALMKLYRDSNERARLGKNAQKHVKEHLTPTRCFADLEAIYNEAMTLEKTIRKFRTRKGDLKDTATDLGAQLFVESLGSESDEFLKSYENNGVEVLDSINNQIANVEPAMKVRTKGSLFQYLYFFPEDAFLNFWAGLIYEKEGNVHAAVTCFEKAALKNPGSKEIASYP